MRSRIEPMKKIARSLRQHRELTSGVVEGLNNKAKVTMRKSYGFRTYRVLELALYHSLAKLTEPESTREFSDESHSEAAIPSYLQPEFSLEASASASTWFVVDSASFQSNQSHLFGSPCNAFCIIGTIFIDKR